MHGLFQINTYYSTTCGFPSSSVVKNLPANAGDVGLIPGSGRSPRVGIGNPFQYSCLKNSMEDQPCVLHAIHGGGGVTKSRHD